MTAPPVLRAGRDDDAAGFIALIGACWAEYPGCVMDLDGEVPELRALATYYAGQGGALWAAEQDGRVVGMVATRPLGDGAPGDPWEICKMYAYADQRGSGLAQALVAAAEGHARARGAARMVLWSDTRFDRAHRFYEKCSYVREGGIRALDDLSHSLEFGYAKPLAGVVVRRLDAAAAVSAVPRLAALAPLPWKPIASRAAIGEVVLLVAWCEGDLVGAAVLDTPAVPDHRGELRLLLVAPAHRRRGIGRALLRAGEAASGRGLLTANVAAGGAAARLLVAEGWTLLGAIPGWTHEAAGAVLWKALR